MSVVNGEEREELRGKSCGEESISFSGVSVCR
jgi:hypothetical protein